MSIFPQIALGKPHLSYLKLAPYDVIPLIQPYTKSKYNIICSQIMDTLLNKIHETALTPLISKGCELLSSINAGVRSHPFLTLFLFGINKVSGFVGGTISSWTRGYIQLNNFVPQSIRNCFRMIGFIIARGMRHTSCLIGRISKIDEEFCKTVVVSPIVEELFFRLPLLKASQKIDSHTSEFITSPVGVGNLTGGQLLKAFLTIIFSIGFTYGHDSKPQPGRAASLFAGGLSLSYLALQPTGGVGMAMVSHMVHNLIAYTLFQVRKLNEQS